MYGMVCVAKGSKAGPFKNAEWTRIIAAEIRKQGMGKTKEVAQANGEAVLPQKENFLYDTLAVSAPVIEN
jgi:hypothetical protein